MRGLFGANGSGKTTFVLHLNGLLRGEGFVEVCGMRIDGSTRADGSPSTGSRSAWSFRTPTNNCSCPRFWKMWPSAQATWGCLRKRRRRVRVGAGAGRDGRGRRAGALSFEQRGKAARGLAGVLAMQPEILVLDEPTTSLDPPGQRDLVRLLRRLPQAKLLVTHDAEFAAALASRAVFFERGRIAGEGAVREIALGSSERVSVVSRIRVTGPSLTSETSMCA